MKQVWMAEDGTTFDTQAECAAHENENELYSALGVFFNNHVEYSSDAGCCTAGAHEIVCMIIDNLPEFMKVMEKANAVMFTAPYDLDAGEKGVTVYDEAPLPRWGAPRNLDLVPTEYL